MDRRRLLTSLLSLPLLKGVGENRAVSYISRLQPATLVEGYRHFTGVSSGTLHFLKSVNWKTGIVSNDLGLGVYYLDPRGIFTEDENYANL